MNKKKFICIKDAMFGIKKGDILEALMSGNSKFVGINGRKVPFDVSTEPAFFEKLKETKFKAGQEICFKKDECLKGSLVNSRNWVKAFVACKITNVKFDKNHEVITINNNGIIFDISEKDFSKIQICEFYWFINSKGIINREVVGKDSKDVIYWRKASGNYFETKEIAESSKQEKLSSFHWLSL